MLLTLLLALPGVAADRDWKPSVLVAVFDDVAERDIDRIPTPTFDGLAASGVRFERAYAAPTCSPARRMLNFGTYWTADSGDPCTGNYVPGVSPPVGDLSLPKIFEGANYRTALFGKWHLGGWPGMDLGAPWELSAQAHGYEVWRAGVGSNVKNNNCPGSRGSYTDWTRVDDGTSSRTTRYQTFAVRDAFLQWHAAIPHDEPWFAMVCFQAPHSPYHAPPGKNPNQLYLPRQKYEFMLTAADRALGAMLGAVNLERTIVVVLGDNGTPEGVQHGTQTSGKLKSTTFEDGIRVPMVWSGPGIEPGLSVSSVVSFVDVLPTLAELVGVDVRPLLGRDGVSLVPCLRDPFFEPRGYAFSGLTNPVTADYAVVTRNWKYRLADGLPELYDLVADPNETVNLAGSAGLEELEGRLAGWLLEHAP